ncbi:hypothetical protein ABW21_db0209737 [Orbilia brochopaga]|nr:hypothetical protein ABW21_db0209737 [Drechslerella brochopaga]
MWTVRQHAAGLIRAGSRAFKTLGPAVGQEEFGQGKLPRGVMLDTNVCHWVLTTKRTDEWLAKLRRAGTVVGVCRGSIAEYISNRRLLATKGYEDIAKEMEAKGLTIFGGPCMSDDSTALFGKVIQAEWAGRVRNKIAEYEAEGRYKTARRYKGKDIPWDKMHRRSRYDVKLACEAHANGLAFVTMDKQMTRDFGIGFEKMGVTIYTLLSGWQDFRPPKPPSKPPSKPRAKKSRR